MGECLGYERLTSRFEYSESTNDLIGMALAASQDERLSTGDLYLKLACELAKVDKTLESVLRANHKLSYELARIIREFQQKPDNELR